MKIIVLAEWKDVNFERFPQKNMLETINDQVKLELYLARQKAALFIRESHLPDLIVSPNKRKKFFLYSFYALLKMENVYKCK